MNINLKRLTGVAIVGLVAGLIFGVFLKIIEQLTGKKVYTLLLNVDYFPVLKNIKLNEGVEFSFHLMVSVILTIVLYYVLRRYHHHHHDVIYYVSLNSLIGAVLFLTTGLSNRTPELLDVTAFLYWLLGHVLFGFLIGGMIQWFDRMPLNKST